ncbi:hypothetical protein FO519_009037 [Halicephalobus sp. NKZ332]|nr:hypothetical protein FO519_009037 [Halicephalobus sp. NKZ332]
METAEDGNSDEIKSSDEADKSGIIDYLKKVLLLIKFCLSNLTVEPIIFLVYLGWVFGNTIQSPGLYRRVCQIYYSDNPYVNCYHLDNDDIEDKVQARAVEWSLYNAIGYLLPAIFADTILGAFGDKYGRQINILLGIFGIAISEFSYMLTLSHSVASPYWTTTLTGVVSGFTGYLALVPVSCNAYLADITEDSDLLTIRSGIFSAAQTFASVIGGFAAALVNGIIIAVAVDIELFCYLLAFIYTIWRIPQKPGIRELERRQRVNTLTSNNSMVLSPKTFFVELFQLLMAGIKTYTRPRIGHRRAFMFLTAVTLMLTYTTFVETRMSTVINSYVFRRAGENSLNWDSADLGYWNGTGFLILIFGTLFGLFLFKKVLHFKETTIIMIGLLSSSARTAIIGFASQDWEMYVANVAGLFAGLVQPATVSFIVQIVPNEEVGRAFSLFGIGGDFAFILTNVVYSLIYRATVSFFPGFLFLFITFVQMLSFLSILWVHIMAIKEGVYVKEEKPRDIRNAISEIGSEGTREFPIKAKRKKDGTLEPPSIYDFAVERGRLRDQEEIWGSFRDMREHRGSFY